MLKFAKQTVEEKRVIGAKTLTDLYTWIDAAYAVQTGGAMSFGHGMIHCRSSMQKINTKSSTESELVGVNDYLPYNLWAKMFLEEQGFHLKTNTIFQDNQSTMKMSINGRTSCTGNSRHINVRYFFVVDKVKNKEIEIKYCPTEFMIADYFTKPLQGRLFHALRDIIMGKESIFELMKQYFQIKERIGNSHVSKDKIENEKNEKEKEIEDDTELWNCAEAQNINGTVHDLKHTVDRMNSKKRITWTDVVRRTK